MSEKTNDELAEYCDICGMPHDRSDECWAPDEAASYVKDLRAEIARLRQQSEDSARLDFVEQLKDGQINYNGVQWVLSIPDQEPPYLWSYPSGKTLRAAIDKARKA